MEQTKVWWQSRIIWTSLVGALFSVLGIFGLLPEGLTSEMVVESIIGIVSIIIIVLRLDTTKAVTITTPSDTNG